MEELFRKHRILIFSILFPALLLLMENSIVNLHTHRLANGSVISHAHPFKKSTNGEKKHQHSNKDFFFIKQLTSFIFFVFTALVASVLVVNKIAVNYQLVPIKQQAIVDCLFPPRAPPILLP